MTLANIRGLAILSTALLLGSCQRQSTAVQGAIQVDFAERPKNIVLLIGDGFGLTQMSAMLYQNGNRCSLESFPVIGLHKNTSADNLITDSAAAATAFACGIKTYNAAVGVSNDTIRCRTILEQAEDRGMATGIIVTSPVTHATPAAFVSHVSIRTQNEKIATDFLKTEIDLFIGGGQKFFERRDDDRNLVKELEKKGYYVSSYYNTDLFQFHHLDKRRNFAYFTADNQPLSAIQGRDYLPYATHLALPFLRARSEIGFFLMIEGSQIDWGGHAKDAPMMLAELRDFDAVIKKALQFAAEDRETLVIVTGDHECGGTAILEGSKLKKLNLGFTTNGHTATLIPVYAFGPQAELFGGIYDNTQLYNKMVGALGW